MTTAIEQGRVEANGLEFAYLAAGEGPLALLLHGFPDDAWTWDRQIDALAGAGYRAVAPFMRGYPPTGPAPDDRYDGEALADDVAGLIRALGEGSAYVAGYDWGGFATSAAMALHPDSVRRGAVFNIGHPATFPPTLLNPRQVHHIFHFWFFQLGDLAAGAVRANDLAFVDYLWDYWSAPGHEDNQHVERLKRETLAPEGAVEAAMSYYPALLELTTQAPELAERLQRAVSVPTLTVFGDHDPARELAEGQHVHFDGEYRFELVQGAGHFVHREQPAEATRLLLDWFGADRRAQAEAA
jgi:pimeloyl-ACP methyl ester carboxylesterase